MVGVGGGGATMWTGKGQSFFFKGVGSPSLGNESTQRCKKKILIYCENDRLGAGKQQRTHVAMLIGWG